MRLEQRRYATFEKKNALDKDTFSALAPVISAPKGSDAILRFGAMNEVSRVADPHRYVKLTVFSPSPPLIPYITDFWVYDIPSPVHACEPAMVSILPDVFPFACFLCGSSLYTAHKYKIDTMPRTESDVQTFSQCFETQGELAGMAVRFTPWGLSHFLPYSADVFAEIQVDFSNIFPLRAIEELESNLLHQSSPQARVRCVETFLMEHIREHTINPLIVALTQSIVRDGGQARIADLARDFALSERTLERRFRRVIGVTPKKYARRVRLQNAFRHYAQCRLWSNTAQLAGYFDQAHLIRECHDMLGLSPEAVFSSPLNQTVQMF